MKAPALLIVLLIGFSLAGCQHIPYGNNPKAGKYYNIRGFKMYVETYGSGKPLLMIHGNNGDMSSFGGTIPYFAKNYQVIVADSRGQSKSRDDRDSISFEMMTDDFAALLDSMHVGPAYIIGWSDGGINAIDLAMRHPDKVIKIAATGANLWPGPTAITAQEWEETRKDSAKYMKLIPKTYAELRDKKMFMLDWAQPNIKLADLKKVQCPALIMCGDHDMIRTDHTELIYKNIPKANLWIVKNSGHGTLFEHKRWFNHNVETFFNEPYSATNTFGSFWSKFW